MPEQVVRGVYMAACYCWVQPQLHSMLYRCTSTLTVCPARCLRLTSPIIISSTTAAVPSLTLDGSSKVDVISPPSKRSRRAQLLAD